MKWKVSILLIIATTLVCIFPMSALAVNETSGQTDVSITVPFPSSPPADLGDNYDAPDVYSYIVNIPSSLVITNNNNAFSISASEMDIPADKQVIVRVDTEKTMEQDGNFYLFLDGDKSSDDFIQCYISCESYQGSSHTISGLDNVVASFMPGELTPYDWRSVFMAYSYEQYIQATEGTYSGTVYYTIGLE